MINIRLYTLITLTFTGLWGIVFYVLSGSSIESKFTNTNNIFYEQNLVVFVHEIRNSPRICMIHYISYKY